MFRWTDDMVRFMRDAAGFGSYQTELAGWICSQIPQARHVCDAGCGLGFLALQLAQRYPRVTAADISEQALDIAHAQAEEKRVSNLEIVQTDLLAYAPETRFDAMVFCLFHWPCSTTLLSIKRETGSIWWTLLSAVIPTAVGALLCVVINVVF